jgi:hypothetical protein
MNTNTKCTVNFFQIELQFYSKCPWVTYTFFWIYHGQLVDGMVKHCIIKGCKPSNKNELDDELPHDNQSEPGQMLPNLDTETDIHVQSDDFVATIYDNSCGKNKRGFSISIGCCQFLQFDEFALFCTPDSSNSDHKK